MEMNEIFKYMNRVLTSQRTPTRNNSLHRCPCCGEPMDGGMGMSRRFRFAVINICLTCQAKESLARLNGTWDDSPEMLKTWWIIQTYDKAGPFPSDEHLKVMEPQVNDDGTVTFLDSECYFDWAQKFGLDPANFEDENTWLNVYFTVDPKTNAVSVEYTVDDNKKNESFVYVPTAEDEKAVLAAVDRYCKCQGETLQEIVNSVKPATEEQEFEIPVKEINYGVAKIRAASLDEARAKIHEAYKRGNIDWGKTEFDFLPIGGADNA